MKVGMIVLDTLRYDVFSDVMETTVNSADHIFERMYATSRWTVPSHASLFTGYYPTEVGTHSDNHHLTTSEPTIAERFSTNDIKTMAYSNNPYIDSFFEFDRGFDELYRGPALQGRPTDATAFDWPSLFSELSDGITKYPEAIAAILRSNSPTIETLRNGIRLLLTSGSLSDTGSIEWLFDRFEESNITSYDNLFMYCNIMACHSPYIPPEEYRETEPYLVDPLELTLQDEPVTEEEHKRHWDCYTRAAKYLDDQLDRIIELVDWDMLFILSDHGELFGEYGLRQHQYGVYEELVHVPAIAIGSAVPAGRTSSLTSLLDVHRTLLNYASIPPGETRGVDLFSEDRDSIYAESVGNYRYNPEAQGLNAKIPETWAQPHYTYRTNDMIYIMDKDGERITQSGQQQNETEIRKRVERFREQLEDGPTNAPEKELTDDIEARLKHLGYQ